jgi:tRNA U34 5-carboxymethylaminomethyl modifying GTPase MnmE/TrmE
MDKLYDKLNQKLNTLTLQHKGQINTHQKMNRRNGRRGEQRKVNRVINLTNVAFTGEQIKTLEMGPQYAVERNPKSYINELIVDTENAIRNLQSNMQNTFRHLAAKKVKQIKESNRHNTIHKRLQYNINRINNTLKENNLTIVKADKSKAFVIISQATLEHKVDKFIEVNDIIKLNKDPTEAYHKLIQQTMQGCK